MRGKLLAAVVCAATFSGAVHGQAGYPGGYGGLGAYGGWGGGGGGWGGGWGGGGMGLGYGGGMGLGYGYGGYGYGFNSMAYGPYTNQGLYAPNQFNRTGQPLSPYLNLFRGTNPAANYYFGVRPGTAPGGVMRGM